MRLIRITAPVFICGMLLIPSAVFAAHISLVPTATQVTVGDTLAVDVILDTEQASVNAVDLTVLYPQLVSVKSISRSGSVLSLWIQEPSFTAKHILLQGGVPGGIVTSHGVLARLTLRATAIGRGSLVLDAASTALLNDGSGTSARLTTEPMVFDVLARKSNAIPAEPTPTPKDHHRPNEFSVAIGTDPSVFGGKRFASFFTTDTDSGMGHYEISEGGGVFRVARSPFLLSDQSSRSVIRIRAYDAAGNWREAVWPGFFHRLWWWIIGIFGFH